MNTDEQKLRLCITYTGLRTGNRKTKFRDHLKSYHRLILKGAGVLRAPDDK